MNKKENDVYQYICKCIQNGFPPTVREICKELGIKSTSTVHKYLNQLEEKCLIEKGNNLNRAIKLVGDQNAVKVPLLGTVAAGAPIVAIEQIEEYIPYKTKLDASSLFALRVKGESMINIGILSGDIVIVKKTPTALNGEVVVALVNDEATVKTFYKEKGYFRLQPENDELEPIIVENVLILGKVISLIRHY